MTSRSQDADVDRALKRAGKRQRDATTERDRLIVEAHELGYTLRAIAALVGLSNPSVLHIIRRDLAK